MTTMTNIMTITPLILLINLINYIKRHINTSITSLNIDCDCDGGSWYCGLIVVDGKAIEVYYGE